MDRLNQEWSGIVGMLICGGFAVAAVAQPIIDPISQTRRVNGNAYAELFDETDFDSDSEEATDFGPFNAAASAQAEIDGGLGSGGGIQGSAISAESVDSSGSAFATGESWDFDSFADGSGGSEMRLQFVLTTESTYRLTGEISAFDNGLCEAVLRDGGGIIVGIYASGPAQTIPINNSGTLPAGTYWLEQYAEGSAFGASYYSEYAFGEYSVTFVVVPTVCQRNCGDTDGDGGTVDLLDFAGLQVCYGNSPVDAYACRCSDLNVDQTIDLLDYAVFEDVMGTTPTSPPPNCS